MTTQEPSGEVPVSVSGSQGVQIGSGNQFNTWGPKPPLDPVALAALNPHTAVDRLLKLSHDELVDFFARANPEDMSEILDIFLYNERLKFIAVLGDISRRKAAGLIATIEASELLRALPDLAHEISRKASSQRLANVGHLEPAQFPQGIVALAYFRRYENGRVWSSRLGTHVTAGLVDQCSVTNFYLGVPVGDLKPAKSSPFGTNGLYQEFERGTVYSSDLGAFCVASFSGAEECYHDQGETGGWLGFPIDPYPAHPKPGIVQKFEGGAIYVYTRVDSGASKSFAFAVRRQVVSTLPEYGWRPVTKEEAVVSSSGNPGTVQCFEVQLESGTCETAVYWDQKTKPVIVALQVWDYYKGLGAEESWLGFPIGSGGQSAHEVDPGMQSFEAATVLWHGEHRCFAVPNAVVDLIREGDVPDFLGLPGVLDFPVSEEEPVGVDGSGRIQYFENGVVTMRDGKREIWLRPEEKAIEPESTANDASALPLASYDRLTLALLSAQVSNLSVEQLDKLIEYEKSHAARPGVIALFRNSKPPQPFKAGRYTQSRRVQKD